MNWESRAMELLAASLVRPWVLAGAAWVLLRVFRVRHPASHHAVWTAVLIGMALLPFVSVMAPPLLAPVLPRHAGAVPAPIALTADLREVSVPQTAGAPEQPPARFTRPAAETLVAWCYLAGLLAMAAYHAMGWAMLRRVVSRSRPWARHLRESADVLTPVAVGVLRPVVLLPVGWRSWSPTTRRAVLAHEFAHLRRRDSLVSAMAQAIRCVFWFHPLAWWIVRKISELAEMACDTAALARVAGPAQYSRILLEFAATAHRAGYRAALPGLAMARSSHMGRRIDRVFEFSGGAPRKLPRPGMILAAIGVPVLCLAATVALGEQGESRPVAFEVASVKAAAPMAPDEDPLFCVARCNPGERLTVVGLRVDLRSMSLAHLIMAAYRIKSYQLSGPAWMESEKFDIAAKIPEGVSKDRLPQMLEALLAGRFKLSIHRESREQPVYALVVGKEGSKLQASTAAPFALDPEGSPMHTPQGEGRRLPDGTFVANDGEYGPIHGGMQPGGGFKLEFLKLTMPKLAEVLTAHADRPVVDMTELKGFYRLTAQNRSLAEGGGRKGAAGDPVSSARPDAFGDALFSAVERAGLKIEKTKAPVETIVVDRVEKTPVVN